MYHELLLMTFGLFLFPKIDAGCAKWVSRAGVSVFVKAFMVMFKMPETIFSRTTYTQLQKKPISHFSGQLWKSELGNENIFISYSVAISSASFR